MRRDELSPQLKQEYSPDAGCGVMHVTDPQYQNIWFVVPPAPPSSMPDNLPPRLMKEAGMVLANRRPLRDATELDLLSAYLIIRREAVSSSRMEGTWSTIDKVLSPESDTAPDQPDANLSVRGYATALETGLQAIETDGPKALTTGMVNQLHAIIMEKDPGFVGSPGQSRAPGQAGAVVQIGGTGRPEDSVYNPCPPDHVEGRYHQIMNWLSDQDIIEMGDAGLGIPLAARMAIGHAHFEAVHPFNNGNGRLGRILWSLQMAASGKLPLYLSGYTEEYKPDYIAALQAAQKQLNYLPIIDFTCKAIVAAATEEKVTHREISILPEKWRRRGNFRAGSTAAALPDLLVKNPVITANFVADHLGKSTVAANAALKKLVTSGILREQTGYKRNRIFVAEEVVHLLGRPFAEDPRIGLEQARRLLIAAP